MKSSGLLLIFLCAAGACFSQKTRKYHADSSNIFTIKYLEIHPDINNTAGENHSLLFGNIEVFDVRFDTTNIGTWVASHYYPYIGYVFENRKINFDNGLADALKIYVSGSYKQQYSDTTLVCFIKQFHLTRRDTADKNQSPNENFGELRTEVECYFKVTDKLYPATRIDTSFINTVVVKENKVTESVNDLLISDFLKALFSKLNKINKAKVFQRTASEMDEIDLKYMRRLNLPILRTNIYPKGVFVTFDEFKNNNPSITEFKIKKEKYKSISLLDKDGLAINTMKIFGFSDGSKLWISFGNYCFPLIKTGNAFEFYVTINPFIKLLADMNMDTGKPY